MSRKQLARAGGDLSTLGQDDTGLHILHLDMDAFFVSVELLARPELVGTPVIVGGRAGRGVVVSASYEAREFGVHAAMPMSVAIRKCLHATIIPPSKNLYARYSAQVFDAIGELTPDYSQVSVDEGYINVAGSIRRLGSPTAIATELRQVIKERTGLTASIGVAGTMVVAKLASARAKPDGLLVVPAAAVAQFLNPMPVEALPGVGGRTQKVLSGYGITTIAQLAAADLAWLTRILGSHGHTLGNFARGIDPRSIHSRPKDHSLSAEHTFDQDVYRLDQLETELLRLADTVARRLRAEGVAAGALGVKYRTADFATRTRSVTLPAPTDVATELRAALLPALHGLHREGTGVRLLGLRASELVAIAAAGRQVSFAEPDHGQREAELALDAVRKKYGHAVISPGSLLPPKS